MALVEHLAVDETRVRKVCEPGETRVSAGLNRVQVVGLVLILVARGRRNAIRSAGRASGRSVSA